MIEPLVQRVCEVAGYDVPAQFPRMTYAQAMRIVRHRQAGPAPAAIHPVRGSVCRDGDFHAGLPLVAIHHSEDRRS